MSEICCKIVARCCKSEHDFFFVCQHQMCHLKLLSHAKSPELSSKVHKNQNKSMYDLVSSVWKAEILKVLKIGNRVTIFRGVTRFLVQNESLVLPLKSWHDFWWRDTILLVAWHDFYRRDTILGAENISYLSRSKFQKQGLRIGESKVRFWDLKTARKANSSTFYQFMYVLIPLLIMLFVNSIMSS